MSEWNGEDIERRYNEDESRDRRRLATIEGKYDRIVIGREWGYYRLIPTPCENTIWRDPTKPTIYKPGYLEFDRHFIRGTGTKPGSYETCPRSGNEYSNPALCPICQADDKEPSRAYAFTILGLAYYHEVPVPRKNNPKQTYIRQMVCERTKTNKNCKWCASEYKYHLGYRGHIAFNQTDFDEIYRIHTKMQTHCRCGGEIVVAQGACPKCQTVILDIDKAGLSDADFAHALNSKQLCPSCGVLVRLHRIRRCTKCASPKPLTMFDCDLRLRKTEVPGKEYLRLEAEIARIGALHQSYGEVKPLDLAAIYAPRPIGSLQRRVRPSGRLVENQDDPNAVIRGEITPPMDLDKESAEWGPPPLPIEAGQAPDPQPQPPDLSVGPKPRKGGTGQMTLPDFPGDLGGSDDEAGEGEEFEE